MGKAILNVKSGKVQLTKWENEFDGKKSYSYLLQKSVKKQDGTWENNNFFSITDLYDAKALIDWLINEKIKSSVNNKIANTNKNKIEHEFINENDNINF